MQNTLTPKHGACAALHAHAPQRRRRRRKGGRRHQRAFTRRMFAAAAMSCGRAASHSARPALRWYSVLSEYLKPNAMPTRPEFVFAPTPVCHRVRHASWVPRKALPCMETMLLMLMPESMPAKLKAAPIMPW